MTVADGNLRDSFTHPIPIPDLFAGGSGNANYRVRASRHDDPTLVEIHTLDTDIFYVTSGTATFIAGGTGVDMKPTSATELRGTAINARPIIIAKATLWWFLPAFPHQFQIIRSPPFLYVEVKVR